MERQKVHLPRAPVVPEKHDERFFPHDTKIRFSIHLDGKKQIESFFSLAHVRTDSFDRFYCFSLFLQVYASLKMDSDENTKQKKTLDRRKERNERRQ